MYMKPNNAVKNIWLWAQTLNQNFKENSQTQDPYGRQDFSVLYKTYLEVISQHQYN